MLELTIKFILAHLIGDFLFQPDKWIEDKKEKKIKSKYLYLHIFVHALVLLFLFQFNYNYLIAIVISVFTHYLIDLAKLHINRKTDARLLFLVDQLLHLIVIFGIVYYYQPFNINTELIYSTQSLLLITFILIITSVSSVVIKMLIVKFKIKNNSTNKAGKYIGMLERLFIFSFILLNYWEGIGFLLAAKSVFRFGDLSKNKDRDLTEYILIGTLLSFGIAMISAMAYKYLIYYNL